MLRDRYEGPRGLLDAGEVGQEGEGRPLGGRRARPGGGTPDPGRGGAPKGWRRQLGASSTRFLVEMPVDGRVRGPFMYVGVRRSAIMAKCMDIIEMKIFVEKRRW